MKMLRTAVFTSFAFAAVSATAQTSPASDEASAIEGVGEIVVTARRREESLQRVPDAVSVITASDIENAGITHVGDFMSLVPNLTYRDGSAFSSGYIFIAMRGIGNGQLGWAPVTFTVDGVPSTSLDAINSGSLDDIARIEVLRGPQSALYGAGAIAGAINVVTERPTNELRLKTRLGYANGDDRSFGAMLSGPIIEDKLLFQVRANYRDADGLFESGSNGIDLGFKEQKKVSGRLLLTPYAGLEFDLRGSFVRENNGSTYQDKLISLDQAETFNSSTDARRAFPGEEDRELVDLSLRVQADFAAASLISVTGYSNIDQTIESSLCYDDPNAPLVDDPAPGLQASCLFGPAFGTAAVPGAPIDNFYSAVDNYETFTQDVRLVSSGDSRIRWLGGVSYLTRKALNGFDGGLITAPGSDRVTLFPSWNGREDTWWGAYGQVSADLTERLELTTALRYDDNEYENTTYTMRDKSTIIPVPDPNGLLGPTQDEKRHAYQPKVQLSFRFTPAAMGYATWSKGFRAGFFSGGSFTLPEKTTNFEVGLKSAWLDKRLRANAAVFHIDYSDQQFSTVINQPPFRVPVTLPETNIDGVELETTFAAGRGLTLGASLGYLDSVDVEDTRSPFAPKWTGNVSADWARPVNAQWVFNVRGDYRYDSEMYLGRNQTSQIPSAGFANLRAGLTGEHWRVALFSKNLFDERQAELEIAFLAGGYVRYANEPRTYGVEVGYEF